ncbi:hypothetical protein [Agrobacterium tumefaciens]|uniref:hypothetical protein n=1 Tax=Agrobacterium tumefaciens TaxID=358 RepID=UPI002243D566|nr:hypothetical protein [Agrobacterium tumefaciens]MCW8060496.1 hypothetical protein [Agrobacterium tumefaciens]MCW8145940.1 hypothetical protein [Agrobacterium tumefaciens]
MPAYTIETTYRLPVYRRRTYEAETVEDACRLAVDDEGWEDGSEDVDTSGETYVTGIWGGKDTACSGVSVTVPDTFGEIVQRKAAMFDELVAILREPTRPMGLSEYQFRHWLPRASALLQKADAIVAGR